MVIRGPDIPLYHLQLAAPTISQVFTNAYTTAVNPIPPSIQANVRWFKLLINGLPIGASDTRDVYTPKECHKSLAVNNPLYSSLLITQKPSWVRPPNSYQAGSSSSLVVTFKDPDGEALRSLLTARYLYALGTRATIKKWKQRAHTQKKSSESNANANKTGKEDNAKTASPQTNQEQLQQILSMADNSSDEEDTEITRILTRVQTPSPIQAVHTTTQMPAGRPVQLSSDTQVQQPRTHPQRRQPSRMVKAKKIPQRD